MTVSLSPGQVVLLRTDGVDEAMSETKQFYGAERFRNLVQAAPPDPETIAKELLSDVRKFMPPGYQNDDITILCFGRSR
jgi:serine phosphatase RsbU (regulator of sigma subunit)